MTMGLMALVLAVRGVAGPTATFTGSTVTTDELAKAYFRTVEPIVINGQTMPRLGNGARYAVVRRDVLVEVAAMIRRRLSKEWGVGITTKSTGWDKRWDCQAFAMVASLELRGRLRDEFWHSASEATRPACFMVGYKPDWTAKERHQILFILTDEGPVWFDPLSGPEALTRYEISSITFNDL